MNSRLRVLFSTFFLLLAFSVSCTQVDVAQSAVQSTESCADYEPRIAPELTPRELIVNGGFETGGFTGWTFGSNNRVASNTPQNGSYFARIAGRYAPNGVHTVSQTIAVPATGITRLSLWARFFAESPGTDDYQEASVVSANNEVLATVFSRARANGQVWQRITYDLSPFSGTTITLRLRTRSSNPSAATSMDIDDVSAMHYPAVATQWFGTPGSTTTGFQQGGYMRPVFDMRAWDSNGYVNFLSVRWGPNPRQDLRTFGQAYNNASTGTDLVFTDDHRFRRIDTHVSQGVLRGITFFTFCDETYSIGSADSTQSPYPVRSTAFAGEDLTIVDLDVSTTNINGKVVISAIRFLIVSLPSDWSLFS
jgi:hypothetical protein